MDFSHIPTLPTLIKCIPVRSCRHSGPSHSSHTSVFPSHSSPEIFWCCYNVLGHYQKVTSKLCAMVFESFFTAFSRYLDFRQCKNSSPFTESAASLEQWPANVCPASEKDLSEDVLDAGKLSRLLATLLRFFHVVMQRILNIKANTSVGNDLCNDHIHIVLCPSFIIDDFSISTTSVPILMDFHCPHPHAEL